MERQITITKLVANSAIFAFREFFSPIKRCMSIRELRRPHSLKEDSSKSFDELDFRNLQQYSDAQLFDHRCKKVLRFAKKLYARRPDWVTFFRETLGVNGTARVVFPHQNDYVRFEQSAEYDKIQAMIAKLRNTKARGGGKDEATRNITVRLPKSLYEALEAEAGQRKVSMNKLCISKLLLRLLAANVEDAKTNTRIYPGSRRMPVDDSSTKKSEQ